ncbi:MAG: hypothetical protein ACOCWB_02510 [Bacteroidota bacterium]
MLRNSILSTAIISLLFVANQVSAQDTSEFMPHGKVFAKVYSDYSTDFSNEEINSVGFNLERSYFGYKYYTSESFSAQVKIDIGNPDDVTAGALKKRMAYVRNAYGTYTLDASTTISFGLIDIMTANLQEKAWGKRYVYKTFQDKHKFGNKTDVGVILKHSVNSQLDVDFAITNGEGYARVQEDMDFVYGFGATIKPTQDLLLRFYGDYSNLHFKPVTLNSLISITPADKISLNAEYMYKFNNAGLENHDLSGLSLYTTFELEKRINFYARYDKLWSNVLDHDTNPWNHQADGNAIVSGIEFTPLDNFRFAINYSGWIFDNSAISTKNKIGVYTEITF